MSRHRSIALQLLAISSLSVAAPGALEIDDSGIRLSVGEEIGEVFSRVDGPDARYRVRGDELYVRARVVSSRRHGNPFADVDVEMAWTQPLAVNTQSIGEAP